MRIESTKSPIRRDQVFYSMAAMWLAYSIGSIGHLSWNGHMRLSELPLFHLLLAIGFAWMWLGYTFVRLKGFVHRWIWMLCSIAPWGLLIWSIEKSSRKVLCLALLMALAAQIVLTLLPKAVVQAGGSQISPEESP